MSNWLLRDAGNPTGWGLVEITTKLQNEVAVMAHKQQADPSPEAQIVAANLTQIAGLLHQAQGLAEFNATLSGGV